MRVMGSSQRKTSWLLRETEHIGDTFMTFHFDSVSDLFIPKVRFTQRSKDRGHNQSNATQIAQAAYLAAKGLS